MDSDCYLTITPEREILSCEIEEAVNELLSFSFEELEQGGEEGDLESGCLSCS